MAGWADGCPEAGGRVMGQQGHGADRFALRAQRIEHGPTDRTLGRAAPLLSRIPALIDVAQAITAAASFDAVEVAVCEAAVSLLRADRGRLVPVGQPASSEPTDAVDPAAELSCLLDRSVAEGRPVVAQPGVERERLLRLGYCSALAAPISVHGSLRSCLLVTQSKPDQVFGEEELQLVGFITAVAGAAFEHLTSSEARFRSFARNSSDVITLVDANGLVTYQSAAAKRVFDNADSVVGRDVRDWAHPDDRLAFEQALAAARHRDHVRIECRLMHASGTHIYVETTVSNLLDEPNVAALVLNTRDVSERRRLEDELRERALHDALTGLPNRTLFHDRARHALERGLRERVPICVAFMDLDDFKAVNDTFGHAVGDELLCAIADRLASCMRSTDTVTRLGGDEFALLLEDTELDTAVAIVERILEAVAQPVALAGTEMVIRASVGLTCTEGLYTDPDQLLAHADAAMYAAKAKGTHGFELFAPEMQAATEARLALRREIDRASSNGEFRLHYQPIIDASTQQIVGMEALIRWAHPERGLLAPAQFVDVAENSGQIVDIGRWALLTACADATRMPPQTYVSVNVSARQLQDPRLVEHVTTALESSGIGADRLVLEITETAAMADTEGTITKLHELKAVGVQLALDDFGTGYSPLSYLRRFPVDLIKIDRSFVFEIERSPADRAIVRGVIDMAHALGLRAVAEGVETAAQYAVLTELGCDLGQGYLWMRPAPLEQVVASV